MTDSERARQAWERSAEAWIDMVRRGDVNRRFLLDSPMLESAGDVAGKSVLDVGCGEGRFCRMLGERGALPTGLDPAHRLVREARCRDPRGWYIAAGAEALPFRSESFDLVVSYITLVDIAGYREAIGEMARVLRKGGRLLVANLQSFATTRERAWYQDEKGEKIHLAVEEYFTERALLLEWGGLSIYNWHRPFESYMSAYLDNGLVLKSFREPQPAWADVKEHPTMLDEYRVPLFHVMLWEKPA